MALASTTILIAATVCGGSVEPTQRRWREEFTAGPFRFHSEFPLKKADLGKDLSQLRKELETSLGLRIRKDPIDVYFFDNKSTYQAFMRQKLPAGLKRKALFVKGPDGSRVYAYRNRDFGRDVRHECTHALIHNALPFVPIWLDEGLAEYFEAKAGQRKLPSRFYHHQTRARFLLGSASLKQMESCDSMQEFARYYNDAWAWVHFLLNDSPETRAALSAYVARIQQGHAPGAFSEFSRTRIVKAESRLVRHFRHFAARYAKSNPRPKQPPPPARR